MVQHPKKEKNTYLVFRPTKRKYRKYRKEGEESTVNSLDLSLPIRLHLYMYSSTMCTLGAVNTQVGKPAAKCESDPQTGRLMKTSSGNLVQIRVVGMFYREEHNNV